MLSFWRCCSVWLRNILFIVSCWYFWYFSIVWIFLICMVKVYVGSFIWKCWMFFFCVDSRKVCFVLILWWLCLLNCLLFWFMVWLMWNVVDGWLVLILCIFWSRCFFMVFLIWFVFDFCICGGVFFVVVWYGLICVLLILVVWKFVWYLGRLVFIGFVIKCFDSWKGLWCLLVILVFGFVFGYFNCLLNYIFFRNFG